MVASLASDGMGLKNRILGLETEPRPPLKWLSSFDHILGVELATFPPGDSYSVIPTLAKLLLGVISNAKIRAGSGGTMLIGLCAGMFTPSLRCLSDLPTPSYRRDRRLFPRSLRIPSTRNAAAATTIASTLSPAKRFAGLPSDQPDSSSFSPTHSVSHC